MNECAVEIRPGGTRDLDPAFWTKRLFECAYCTLKVKLVITGAGLSASLGISLCVGPLPVHYKCPQLKHHDVTQNTQTFKYNLRYIYSISNMSSLVKV